MASYSYISYGKTSSISVEKGSSARSVNGFVANVTGNLDLVFRQYDGQGGIVDLYCITVAANDAVVISMKETSDIGYCAYTPSASSPVISVSNSMKSAADVINGSNTNYAGFSKITTDSGSTKYYLNNFGSNTAKTFYVAVKNTQDSYSLRLSDTSSLTSVKELAQNASSYMEAYWRLSDEEKNSIWNGYNSSTNGITWLVQQKDPVKHEYLYRELADTADNLLGEVPLVTYNLSITSANDTEAPEWIDVTDSFASVKEGSVFVSWGKAVDDWCTASYTAVLTDENGNEINRQTNGLGCGYCCNGLSAGEYTLTVSAQDWAGNVQTDDAESEKAPLSITFSVAEPTGDDFRIGFSGLVESGETVSEDAFTITESGWYSWANFTSSTDTLTAELVKADGSSTKAISTATMKNGALSAKDFFLDAGTYCINVKGKSNAATGYTVCVDSSYIGEGNDHRSFNTAEVVPAAAGATVVSGYVGIDADGGNTAASHYYLYSTASGVTDGYLSLDLTGIQSKIVVTLYNSRKKKIASQTITSPTEGLFAGTLLDACDSYYVSVVSGDNGKGGYNTLYELEFNYDQFPVNGDSENWKAIDSASQFVLSRNGDKDAYSIKKAETETIAEEDFGEGCTLVDDHWVGYKHLNAYWSFTCTDMNGKYTFNLTNLSDIWYKDTASITVYQLKKNASGTVVGRSKVKSVSTSKKTPYAVLSGLLLQKGVEYCIEVTSKNKKGSVYYDLEMSSSTVFYTKANQAADNDWRTLSGTCEMQIDLSDTASSQKSFTVSAGGTAIEGGTGIFNADTLSSTSAAFITNEWVGNGDLAKNDSSEKDLTDYRKLTLNCAGEFSFILQASAASTITVYQKKNGSDSLTKLKSASTSSTKKEVVLKNVLLDAGEEYYIAVKSKSSSTGAWVDYSVTTGTETRFFFGRNLNDEGWLSSVNDNRFSMKLNNSTFSHVNAAGEIVDDPGETEWVGFGDKEDYILLTDVENGFYDLRISGLSAKVKVTVYELTGDGKKSLQSKTVTPNQNSTEYTLQNLLLGQSGKEYAVCIEASNWKKAQNTSYVLTVTERTEFIGSDSSVNPYKLGAEETLTASVTKTQGGDICDYFDLSNWNAGADLYMDADRGKMKITFYDEQWNAVAVSAVNAQGAVMPDQSCLNLTAGNKTGDNVTVKYRSGVCFAKVEALDKGNDKYSMGYLASTSC